MKVINFPYHPFVLFFLLDYCCFQVSSWKGYCGAQVGQDSLFLDQQAPDVFQTCALTVEYSQSPDLYNGSFTPACEISHNSSQYRQYYASQTCSSNRSVAPAEAGDVYHAIFIDGSSPPNASDTASFGSAERLFCSDVSYVVAVNETLPSGASLGISYPFDSPNATCGRDTVLYLDALAAAYQLKARSVLDRYNCKAFYPYLSCQPCLDAYKRWLCATIFPRSCQFSDASGRTGEIAKQYDCADVCFEVSRKCPVELRFKCPPSQSLGAMPECNSMTLDLSPSARSIAATSCVFQSLILTSNRMFAFFLSVLSLVSVMVIAVAAVAVLLL